MSKQIKQARADGRSALTEPEGKALAAQFGLVVPQSVLVSPKEDLRAALQGMSPPFVVKVVSPDILHKSDAGGVKVGLTDHPAVSEAVQDMAAIPAIASANVEGYLVEEMAPAGQEIVIGGL
ncbi:MAG: acetate--CoA ligase family protein, partial [Pseudomonadota bacterium]|nr:acetate--CoA ligase family protein [Pseudomonadota bacterium]